MPELPDVEVFRRYFDATCLHQPIDDIQADNSVLEGVVEKKLRQVMIGKAFVATRRHGKYLFARIGDGGPWLVIHFGMTGFLKYHKSKDDQPPHTRMQISFDNGYHLSWDCQRKLGRVRLSPDAADFIRKMELGVDALSEDLDFEKFRERIGKSRGFIKSSLMNQSLVSGIGNVYADEILYHAGIYPKRKLSDLGQNELKQIFDAMGYVLNKAVDANAEPADMPGDFMLTRRGTDKACACGGPVEKIAVSGRTGYYCPKCQK